MTYRLDLRVQHAMPASSALRRLADAPGALELHLPAADGAVGHAGVLLDGFLIAASFEQDFYAVALVLVIGFAHARIHVAAMTRDKSVGCG
jgi:hypothetical protein